MWFKESFERLSSYTLANTMDFSIPDKFGQSSFLRSCSSFFSTIAMILFDTYANRSLKFVSLDSCYAERRPLGVDPTLSLRLPMRKRKGVIPRGDVITEEVTR